MTSVDIRQALIDDAEAIASIHVASWQKTYRGLVPNTTLDSLSVNERTNRWQNLITKGIIILLVEYQNKVIGFASLGPARDPDLNSKICGEVTAIYLHPDFQHQGFGKKLFIASMEELKKMGFTEIVLWVLKGNKHAQQFYERMGFINTEISKTEQHEDDVLLTEIRYMKKLNY